MCVYQLVICLCLCRIFLWTRVVHSNVVKFTPCQMLEGKKRQGQQRIRWLDSITDSMDMDLSKFRETVKNREASCCGPCSSSAGFPLVSFPASAMVSWNQSWMYMSRNIPTSCVSGPSTCEHWKATSHKCTHIHKCMHTRVYTLCNISFWDRKDLGTHFRKQ